MATTSSRFGAMPVKFVIRAVAVLIALYVILVLALMWWWSYEPAQFDVVARAKERAASHSVPVVTG